MRSTSSCARLQQLATDAGYHFDAERADWPRRWMSNLLRHTKGRWAGRPFELLDWQWDHVVAPLFGWVHRETGRRRYRMAHIEIPKKNGKTALCSALGLYMLVGDGEASPEVYTCATKADQASVCHNFAIAMVESSPTLAKHLRINRSTRNIYYPRQAGIYRALSADAGGAEGIGPSALIIDELHVWKGHAFWESLRYGTSARWQPLIICITTAGIWQPEGIGFQRHQYAQGLLDGHHDDIHTLAVISAADADADWLSPETWKAANPSWGVTVDPEEMATSAREAQASPRGESVFRRYRLNQWLSHATTWIEPDDWDACSGGIADPRAADVVYAALNMRNIDDMVCAALCWLDPDDMFQMRAWYWAPAAASRRRTGGTYKQWSDAGRLVLTPGDRVDHVPIRQLVTTWAETLPLVELAFDPWNCTQLAREIEDEAGIAGVQYLQTARHYNEPTRAFEKLARARRIRHDGHPILAWNVANTRISENSEGHIRPDRSASPDLIDGTQAGIMALARCILGDQGLPGVIAL